MDGKTEETTGDPLVEPAKPPSAHDDASQHDASQHDHPSSACPTNQELAALLRETAELLEEQGANPYRVRAYRQASETVATSDTPIWQTVESAGLDGLRELPGIGQSIAGALERIVRTNKFPLLDRLRGEDEVERIFSSVAGIGPILAQRIHEHLNVDSLAELEAAAWDGRLARVPGMGTKRLRAVRESLAGRFHHRTPPARSGEPDASQEIPVSELLDVDQQYRELAKKNQLPRIAPRRFNPTRAAWLPILHTERGPRHYTAMYSNTARAHEMGTTDDWVVIFRDDEDNHGQWTVITSHFGRLRGKRIVRGRESECQQHYARQATSSQADQPFQQRRLNL